MDTLAKKRTNISVDRAIYDEIKEYCDINNLKIGEFVDNMLKTSLADIKWGDAPFLPKKKEVVTYEIPDVIRKHAERVLLDKEQETITVLDSKVHESVEVYIPQVDTDESVNQETEPVVEQKPKRRKVKSK